MGNGLNLPAIYIANGMALLLSVLLLFGNNKRYVKNKSEFRVLSSAISVCAVACMIDPIVCVLDGRPGTVARWVVYIGNMLLYFANLYLEQGWLVLICNRLLGRVPKIQYCLIIFLCSVGAMAVFANCLIPVVFTVDANNVYQRGPLFWLFPVIAGIFIADSILVYLYARRKGGIFKFYPILHFAIPVVAGIAVQCMFYGISVIYPAIMIALVGLFDSFRNEAFCIDSLTGLYNRMYLDDISAKITKKGADFTVTALMADMNGFKDINDRFGHAEGDSALKKVASILTDTVGAIGCTVRYAGDEFVILLYTRQTKTIEECIRNIHRKCAEVSETIGKEYQLSMSIGYCVLSEKFPTLDDIISESDRHMYTNKKRFYSDPRNNRRARDS